MREHAAFRAEVRTRRADGEWRWIASYAEPRFAADGQYLGHIGLSPDVTERKQAEQALKSSEEQFRQLAENIREVFFVLPPGGKETTYVSPAYEQVWGRSCESLQDVPLQLHNLRQGLDRADAPGARLQAEMLKTAAAAVEAPGLAALALAIERAGSEGQLDRCGELLPRVAEEFDRLKTTLEDAGWCPRAEAD